MNCPYCAHPIFEHAPGMVICRGCGNPVVVREMRRSDVRRELIKPNKKTEPMRKLNKSAFKLPKIAKVA